MKKTYIIPAIVAVELGTCKMMAESLTIYNNSDDVIEDESEFLTRENRNINLWDEEW